MTNPVGRPSKYTPELAEEICNAIASSDMGIRKLCAKNPHWPAKENIRQWVNKMPDFRAQYINAKAAQVDWLVERAYEVATDATNDSIIDDEGMEKCDVEWVNRCRLHVDFIKWFASKLAPKIYGDKTDLGDKSASLLQTVIDKL
jgi:terminase small subunit-like protein